MRPIKGLLLCLSVACAATAASAAQPVAHADAVSALRASSTASVSISQRASTGKAKFLRTDGDLLPTAKDMAPAAKARAFFDRHGQVLGLRDASDLRQLTNRADAYGNTTLKFEQLYAGVPVFGSYLNANFRADGSLYAVNGDVVPQLSVDTRPQVTAQQATRLALAHIAITAPVAGLTAKHSDLYVYRLDGRSNTEGTPTLVWHVEVGNGRDIREFVVVHAHNGKIVDQYTGIHESLQRQVYDGGYGPSFQVWAEGQSTPFGSTPIDNLIEYTSDTYYFYANLTGGNFLSWDGNDGIMHAVNNEPTITCPNANWNGVSINFCDGTSSDDVVGHEWSHAYTEATHGLIYRWQSGALNESYSDIFGETIDLLNADGTDAPATGRAVGSCSAFGGSAPPALQVLSPAGISGAYAVSGAAFNPSSAEVTGNLVLANDAVGTGSDACEPISNVVTGAVALVDRGSCPFTVKVLNAQAAGAIGVVVANNDGDGVINMGGTAAGISIPSVMVGQTVGQTLRNSGTPTVNIVIGGASQSSLRWLMGEDAGSFGGAIRDMWEPRCMGDPGKVSDTEYYCASTDGGGVHSNSGVPNHAYALLVDGGTFNGQSIAAIGLARASAIYWLAATNYQGPTTDFGDHADALEAACAELIDETVPGLSTEAGGAGGGQFVSAADCAAVAAAIDAVELRLAPVQCNFATLLSPDAPELCATGTAAQSILSEDFESGLAGWTAGRRAIANPATFSGPDWSVVANLPNGRAGSAAYGPNQILGNCVTDIEAGVVYLDSPVIALPGGISGAKLAFDHSVMTEADYDGGNLKVSVNGSAYTTVPASAFTFNGYNGSLVSSDNPLAGQPAFHGADGGSLTSEWGQSQIDLSGIAIPGDTVRLRFELGMDGCNGLDGWYVDDVELYSCEVAPDVDGDSWPDASDNCIEIANADQRDTDSDGYGNVCDADLDNDNLVNFGDLFLMQQGFFATPASPNWNENADFNNDGFVNFADLQLMQAQFFGQPGPSGLAP